MGTGSQCFWILSLTLSLYFIHSTSSSHVYIVYLGHAHHTNPLLTYEHHVRHLASVFHSKEEAKEAMVYSYKHSLSGFAATLNASQAAILTNTRGVISVFRSRMMKLCTTRSWDFMGLTLDYNGGTPLQLSHGEDVIVGVFDSGVWPESPSFHEEPGTPLVPKRWKGACERGDDFDPKKHCNRKLIGAKYFKSGFERSYGKIDKTKNPEYISARDILGHGTHTASTAAGSRVRTAGLSGAAGGVARGGAPRARLAVYKVCWSYGGEGACAEADVLAAFDEAVRDGVDVISASIGRKAPARLESAAGVGSFHAVQMGVSVVFAAGNAGPDLSTVDNVFPWGISVAASTLDRSFPTEILVDGDGAASFVGEALIEKGVSGALARTRDFFYNGICDMDNRNLTGRSASGLILVCFSNDGSETLSVRAEYAASLINATALIFVQPITRPLAALSIVPVVRIDLIQGTKLGKLNYGTKLHIRPSETALKRSSAPMVAAFSSRGPSSISPDFLKPDISAPGVNILASWSPKAPPTIFPGDSRSIKWNMLSGTSMSCPHVSGVVALIKSAHPLWSPAAIRSALLTTAHNTDIYGDGIAVEASEKSADPFDIGSGHIDPLKALDPGLIYDTTTQDYVNFLCNMGYSEAQLQAMVICPQVRCPDEPEPNWNINYPSISVSDLRCATTVKRTLKNVGHSKTAVYYVSVVKPHGVEVVVWPRVLMFSPFKEEITYRVTMSPLKISRGRYDFGSITWSDGFHHVRSPLVVQVNTNEVLTASVI
ncbi:subtilisin-like protease SBT3.18 [Salvia divinorum]|uniref:Subtilisin-like protease SBT3.18 n=1 Tax=Salvia divinorum TaxID=28513 RepID=A0ABD1IAI1_SALDI